MTDDAKPTNEMQTLLGVPTPPPSGSPEDEVPEAPHGEPAE